MLEDLEVLTDGKFALIGKIDNTLYFKWKPEFIGTIEEAKELGEVIIDHYRENALEYYISDNTDQKTLPAEVQEYLATEWLSQIVGLGLKKMAVLVPKSVVASMSLNSTLRKVDDSNGFLGTFSSIEECMNWLKD